MNPNQSMGSVFASQIHDEPMNTFHFLFVQLLETIGRPSSLYYNRNASGLDFEESLNLTGKATNLGVQGGARLEIRIVERAFLFFGVQSRSVKISGFQGSEYLFRKENLQTIPTTEKIDMPGTLYFVPDNPYPRLAVFPKGTSGTIGARLAVFDFTGADLLAGIHIRF